jgi:hypothetical protein
VYSSPIVDLNPPHHALELIGSWLPQTASSRVTCGASFRDVRAANDIDFFMLQGSYLF